MPLARRLYLAAGLATVMNALCWALSVRFAEGETTPQTLLILMTIMGGIYRAPFELVAVIFVFLPISATLGARTTPGWTTSAVLTAGALTGLLVAAVMRYADRFPDVTAVWWSASFVVSAMIWSILAIVFPPDVIAANWRTAANLAIDAALPGIRKADRAIPWVAGAFLLYMSPLIVVGLMFVGYTLLS